MSLNNFIKQELETLANTVYQINVERSCSMRVEQWVKVLTALKEANEKWGCERGDYVMSCDKMHEGSRHKKMLFCTRCKWLEKWGKEFSE